MAIFDRLMGLETEYAIRFQPHDPGAPRPTDRRLYRKLIKTLGGRLPIGDAEITAAGKPGVFTANGGAVWFEFCRHAGETGLIEGCTPECRGPMQLLAAQRAQDRLLAEAARDAASPDTFALIKNCRDSDGHAYGAQENYQVVLARGWRLAAWRAGMMILAPLFALSVLAAMAAVLLVTLLSLLVAAAVYLSAGRRLSTEARRRRIAPFVAPFLFSGDEMDAPWPPWSEPLVLGLMQGLLMPASLLTSLLFMVTDMHRVQRKLLPFLISRVVLAGAGWLDAAGRFHVAEKALSRRRIFMHLLLNAEQPIYSLGSIIKPCELSIIAPWRLRDAFARHHRLQVSLGDSNMCEEAEYLRIATTALVLDAIEAGAVRRIPTIRRPLRALRLLSGDPSLAATVKVRRGARMTALEIQRFYLEACRRFVRDQANPSAEAHDVLRRWDDALDALESDRPALVGRIDWITKRFLLDQAGADAARDVRKKIDLRYHELSDEGYFARLSAAGHAARIVPPEMVERAQRMPPPNTTAAERGRIIREFSQDGGLRSVGWTVVWLGGKFRGRRIRLGRDQAPDSPTPGSTRDVEEQHGR